MRPCLNLDRPGCGLASEGWEGGKWSLWLPNMGLITQFNHQCQKFRLNFPAPTQHHSRWRGALAEVLSGVAPTYHTVLLTLALLSNSLLSGLSLLPITGRLMLVSKDGPDSSSRHGNSGPKTADIGILDARDRKQRGYAQFVVVQACGTLVSDDVQGYTLGLLRACTTFPHLINNRLRFEVLWRTIITDETHDHKTPAPPAYASSFWNYLVNLDGQKLERKQRSGEAIEDYFQLCDQYLSELDTTSAATEEVPVSSAAVRRFVEAHATPQEPDTLHPYVSAVGRAAWPYLGSRNGAGERTMLFRTTGGLMGVCNGPCRPGDGVWCIREAHVPFVLRGDGEGVRLVGACFVLDFMQGKMARDEAVDIAIV